MTRNNRLISLTLLTTCLFIVFLSLFNLHKENKQKSFVTVGYIYEGDGCTSYTANFMEAQSAIEQAYGDKIKSVPFYNIKEERIESIYEDLIAADCDIVFSTSYGYGKTIKQWAKNNPDIQFCQATCSDANEGEFVENYHNYMGAVYEARYVTGVLAAEKLLELVKDGVINEDEILVGYVAAYPYSEVISGYTAFLLGVRSRIPDAQMKVIYTNSWADFYKEKAATKQLIEAGCCLISQHSDTAGVPMQCEEMSQEYTVINVGNNDSLIEIAPTTTLITSRINYAPYEVAAVGAVINSMQIEKNVNGTTRGNDSWGGFREGWVEVIGLNEYLAPDNYNDIIDQAVFELENNRINVFSGDYTGTDPFNPEDTIDLAKTPFHENELYSAPMFHYILEGVIEILE